MSNVIAFPNATKIPRRTCLAALLRALAVDRHGPQDVMWFKEAAEALSILRAMREPLPVAALAPFAAFYEGAEAQAQFYPQYYRFFLSMVLDLEDFGVVGSKGAALCDWAAREGLMGAELSDLQRAEARLLLARRDMVPPLGEGELAARLRAFLGRSETFALPNKKAGYELTHIVFYLSDYGRRDPELTAAARRSLEYCGLVAYLEQNHDLLAEVCVAMRYAGMRPNAIWAQTVGHAHGAITPAPGAVHAGDGYHAFMVTGWAQAVAGQPGFTVAIPKGGVVFRDSVPRGGALRPLSAMLFALGRSRRREWERMRERVVSRLDGPSRVILERAEQSSENFEAFFSAFARASA